MVFQRTNRFKKEYRRLSHQDQRRVDKALRTLAANPLHPSLHIEKVGSNIWSMRASDRLRCTFDWDRDTEDLKKAESITLRNVGYHDEVYHSP